MKKVKLLIITFISLLLPSCTNTTSPSLEDNNIISGESERLNDFIEIPQTENNIEKNLESNIDTEKFPASGKIVSGESLTSR